MAASTMEEEIREIRCYKNRPVILHGYLAPFILIYAAWFYIWLIVYGIEGYLEIGLISLAVIVLLQILTGLFCFWSVDIRCLLTCSKVSDPFMATSVKVVPALNNGFTELCVLYKNFGHDQLWFTFQKTKYTYDPGEKRFTTATFPDDLKYKTYMDWKGYQDEAEFETAQRDFGKNLLEMDIPKFVELFIERATAPFFVFQVFCVGLWCLDEYWYYSLFTLFMLIVFEVTLVQQQLRNMAEIRKMGNKPYNILVFRSKKWKPILTTDLVPGDIVSIGRSNNDRLVPCDMLLLRGPCIVDESMLTGESVPVMKEPIEMHDPNEYLNLETGGKLHILYGGTKVVQHTAPDKSGLGLRATDNGCIAYVIRHSFSTSQGKLLRTILYSVKRVTANNLETFAFIMFLLVFAVTAASYVWIKGTENPDRNRYKLFLECTLILTSVVPPELPIELSLAVNTSLLALSKLSIYCTEPFRIPFAGKIDICCFDKTGTLTSDDMIVEGVMDSRGEMKPAKEAPIPTIHVLATCHSLVQLDDEMVGDPLEKATLLDIDWSLTKADVVIPHKHKTNSFKIYHRFHFSSALKRMSVITGHTSPGVQEVQYMVATKGAPETLKSMFSNVPPNYDDVYLSMARRGARILALGFRKIGHLSHQQVRDLVRSEVESKLTFAGFIVFSCPLKHGSKQAIKEIVHASHHVTMITGDNPLTACHVSKELHMTRNQDTLILQSTGTDTETTWQWQSVDNGVRIDLEKKLSKDIVKQYDLCLTGEALTYVQSVNPSLLKKLLPNVRIFARVNPKQKEFVITTLKSLGYVTLMCGDGTNDVGALKHAHVGVALLANAPERFQDKKSKKEEEGSDVDPPTTTSGKLAALAAKGKIGNRGANKSRTRPETNTQKKLANMMKDMEEEEKAQVVRLGDASIASPFTSKLSSTTCICNVIKQGRCTLVTTLQMFKILALNALVLAYSQSVLYLDGIKFSDTQATVQGLLLAGCFLFISRSKPLKILSKERPLPNIFNLYTLLTVTLQFAVHFTALVYLVQESKSRSPPREGEFVDLEKEFEPSILNTTVYIISMSLQLSTFAVNYKGLPFMESLIQNKPLLYSILISGSCILCLASGLIPDLSQQFELVILPDEFRNIVLCVLCLDVGAAFLIDRTCQFLLGNGRVKSTI